MNWPTFAKPFDYKKSFGGALFISLPHQRINGAKVPSREGKKTAKKRKKTAKFFRKELFCQHYNKLRA